MSNDVKWIAYCMLHDKSTGIVDLQGKASHIAVEALQAVYRKQGKPDGIAWQGASNMIDALIASARLNP